MKDHLIDELDYNLVPADGWHKLVQWYGIAEGQVTSQLLSSDLLAAEGSKSLCVSVTCQQEEMCL